MQLVYILCSSVGACAAEKTRLYITDCLRLMFSVRPIAKKVLFLFNSLVDISQQISIIVIG